MRLHLILLLSVLQGLAGCSVMLANSGQHGNLLKKGTTQDVVRAELGTPSATYMDRKFLLMHDVYILKGKMGDNQRAEQHALMDAMTLSVWEVIATPVELFRAPIEMFTRKKVVVRYDKDGTVIAHFIESVDSREREGSDGAEYHETPAL